MTTNKLATPRPSLLELAAKAAANQEAGKAAAHTAVEGLSLRSTQLKALQEFARLDPETQAALDELENANESIKTNAYARREWLRAQIQAYALEDTVEYGKCVALIYASCARHLKNGTPALNLLAQTPLGEIGRWRNRLVIARTRDEKGQLQTGSPMMLVPSTTDDDPAVTALRQLRDRGAEALVEFVESEMLIHDHRVLRAALVLFEFASIRTQTELDAEFTNGEKNLLRRIRDNKHFTYCRINDTQFFLAAASGLSERLTSRMDELASWAAEFWKGSLDAHEMVDDFVTEQNDSLIGSKEFLDGAPGLLAVRYKGWKASRGSEELIDVSVIFDRRVSDSRWRWVICNPKAVRSLFEGKRLAMHDFTAMDIPPHVRHLILRGENLKKN